MGALISYAWLCGLLVLGNVDFSATADDKAIVSNEEALATAEGLLGCVGLALPLTSKEVGGVTGRSSFIALQLTVPQAEAARDAAIKEVYVRLFDWVCDCINGAIGGSLPASSALGRKRALTLNPNCRAARQFRQSQPP